MRYNTMHWIGVGLLAGLLSGAAAAQPLSGTIAVPGTGAEFTMPDGWVGQAMEAGYAFQSSALPGLLLVLGHEAPSVEALRQEASQGIDDGMGTALRPTGEVQTFGERGVALAVSGTVSGQPAEGYAVGIVAPEGGGGTFLVLTEPGVLTAQHRAAVEQAARSLTFAAPTAATPAAPPSSGSTLQTAADWTAYLRGCRLTYLDSYSSNTAGGGGYTTDLRADLCDGYFSYYGADNNVFGNEGALMSRQRGSGTWDVSLEGGQPVLHLRFHGAETESYALSHDGDGKLHLDGLRVFRTCNPQDAVEEARPACQ